MQNCIVNEIKREARNLVNQISRFERRKNRKVTVFIHRFIRSYKNLD